MDFKKHLVKAWESTLKYIAPLILMTLAMGIVSLFSLGILAPVLFAGYMHSLLLMLRENREPKIQDLFSQMSLFFPLLGFGIVVFIALLIGFLLLILPGIIIALGLAFSCLYMLPLMVDKKSGLFDAIKESFSMATTGNVLDHVVTLILFMGISGIGGSVFIGWLFTQPLATIFLLSAYEEKISAVPETQPATEG
ncbi:MAG: hypothetical protein JXD19_09405 [Deltaproteobacteria bacterium]|nr:hypothetical protein [Deltaproteobacteria bacterium]